MVLITAELAGQQRTIKFFEFDTWSTSKAATQLAQGGCSAMSA
jgi:hypothetical protein